MRLNKGTQTEGDAVRAWDELLPNIADPKLVKDRLEKIIEYNNAAATEHQKKIGIIRDEYGKSSLELNRKVAASASQTKTTGATGSWKVVR